MWSSRTFLVASAMLIASGCSEPIFPDTDAGGSDSATPTGGIPDSGDGETLDSSVDPDAALTDAGPTGGLQGLVVEAPSVIATGACAAVSVRLAASAVGRAVAAQLESDGRGTLSTSNDCSASAATLGVELPANGDAVTVFWKPALAAGYVADATLTARATGLAGSARAQVRRAATEVAVGYAFATALLDDGSVWLWGHADGTGRGSAGYPLMIVAAPTRVPGLSGANVHGLVAGSNFACVQVGDAARCFGHHSRVGNSGADTSLTPVVAVKGMDSGVTDLAARGDQACAVKDGAVWCWGNFGDERGDPVAVTGLTSGASQVAVGADHGCALLNDGSVKCWGGNLFGQLGDGTESDSPTPVSVRGLGSATITSLHASLYSSCVVSQGAVRCWGDLTSKVPATLAGLEQSVTALATGDLHYCATKANATTCWGQNDLGALGDGTLIAQGPPGNQVRDIGGELSQVALGRRSSCAIRRGLIYCWGRNTNGELGVSPDLDPLTRSSRVPNMADKRVSAISFGPDSSYGSLATCAVADGSTYCWGSNFQGALGLASDEESLSTVTPFEVRRDVGGGATSLGAAKRLASYAGATCAIVGTELVCWGRVPGIGTREPTAIDLPADSPPVDVCLGENHGCMLLSGASPGVYCWGSDSVGQLGDTASHGAASSSPVLAKTSATPTALACTALGTCAVVAGGLECWGEVADSAAQPTPTAIANLEPVLATHPTLTMVALSERRGCALTQAGEVWCWKQGEAPAAQDLGGKVIDRVVGGALSTFCARDAQGLTCWGSNTFGAANPEDLSGEGVEPTRIKGLVAPIGDFATGVTSCALDAQGMKCWGTNATRTYGGNAVFFEKSPVLTRAFVE